MYHFNLNKMDDFGLRVENSKLEMINYNWDFPIYNADDTTAKNIYSHRYRFTFL